MAGKTGDGSRFASCSEGVFETGFAGTVPDGYGNGKKASGTTETVDDGGNETDAGMNEGGSCREGLLHQGYPVNAFPRRSRRHGRPAGGWSGEAH